MRLFTSAKNETKTGLYRVGKKKHDVNTMISVSSAGALCCAQIVRVLIFYYFKFFHHGECSVDFLPSFAFI